MANTKDAKSDAELDLDKLVSDADPFAETGAPEEGEGGMDPFDFSAETAAPPAPVPATEPKRAKTSSPKVKTPAASGEVRPESAAVGLSSDVPVQVVAVLGKKTITVRDLISFKKGEVVELNRFPNEAVDLVANGKLMAKGELVEIDGKLGVRIIKIFE